MFCIQPIVQCIWGTVKKHEYEKVAQTSETIKESNCDEEVHISLPIANQKLEAENDTIQKPSQDFFSDMGMQPDITVQSRVHVPRPGITSSSRYASVASANTNAWGNVDQDDRTSSKRKPPKRSLLAADMR